EPPPRAPARATTPVQTSAPQTISQPYMVALMTSALELRAGDRVLEIGTGSGYQTAVLAELGVQVLFRQGIPGLAERARLVLGLLGHTGVRIEVGDGGLGWPDA